MEKFTNDRGQFIAQIKLELQTYEQEDDWKSVCTYSEIPHFLTYGFSYNWAVNKASAKYRLRSKEWDAEYDHARFGKGIYNLDRLAIIERENPIASQDETAISLN